MKWNGVFIYNGKVVFPGMREELLSSSTEETTNRYMLLIMCEDLQEHVEGPRTGSLPT